MSAVYNILAVFIGSGIGGVCRWGVSTLMNGRYPIGTLVVNVIGCLLISMISKHITCPELVEGGGDSMIKMLLVTGFCGGFTTFSTFINEHILMMRGEQLLLSLAYMVVSLVLGLLACWIGWRI